MMCYIWCFVFHFISIFIFILPFKVFLYYYAKVMGIYYALLIILLHLSAVWFLLERLIY